MQNGHVNPESTAAEVKDFHSSFFRTGVHSSSSRNDGMQRSSTRHHRLRVRQQTEKSSVFWKVTEIKHEVVVRRCHRDGFQAWDGSSTQLENLSKFRMNLVQKDHDKMSVKFHGLQKVHGFFDMALELWDSHSTFAKKVIDGAGLAIARHYCVTLHVTWKDMEFKRVVVGG